MTDPQAPAPFIPPPPPEAPPADGSSAPASAPAGWSSAPASAPAPRRRRGLAVGAIGVVLALLAGALVVVLTGGKDSAEAQPLTLAFTQGQSESYAIHQTMQGQMTSDLMGDMPLDMDISEVVTWKVTSVDADGTATIEVSVSEMSGSVNGMAVPAQASAVPPVEIVVAADGRILSAGGMDLGGMGGGQGFGFPGMGQLTPILPDGGEPVAPGDTWEKHFSQDFPYGDGTIEVSSTSTYDRNETVNGVEAAVIVTKLSVPMDFTMNFQDLIDSLGQDLGAAGATGIGAIADASVVYSGNAAFTQTSFVDLDAKQLLRTESTGDFDITMTFAQLAGFDGAMTLTGTFTQEMERR